MVALRVPPTSISVLDALRGHEPVKRALSPGDQLVASPICLFLFTAILLFMALTAWHVYADVRTLDPPAALPEWGGYAFAILGHRRQVIPG